MIRRILAALIGAAAAHAAAAQSSIAPNTEDTIVTTRHQITVGGRTIAYTARAGRIPIRDNEAGDVHGNMFFVSYTVDRAPGQPPRPLTFLWNGGPGSNAGLVHLLGFGPKHVVRAAGAKATLSPAGTALEDNQGTWLDQSDLVFVDPIGTGYSRMTKAEYAQEFYTSLGDAESVAEFIRVYRNRYDAGDQPLFLAGESYGVTRAAWVAEALERRRTHVGGVILLSLALPLGQMAPELREALGLPTLAAAAFYHKRLAPELEGDLQATLRQTESWAETVYAPALARRGISAKERTSLLTAVSRFTGIPVARIDTGKLHVSMEQFAKELLRDQRRVVGHYDSRLTGPLDTTQRIYDPTIDPSLKDILDPASVLRYLRQELQYRSDLNYQGPFGGGYPPPTSFRGDWMSVKWSNVAMARDKAEAQARTGRGQAAREKVEPEPQPLGRAMEMNPALHVLSVCGYYDLVCDASANQYLARHLPANLANRVTVRTYVGGHAVYTDDDTRLQLKRDVAAFMRSVPQAQAASDATPATPPPSSDEEIVTTRHRMVLDGEPLEYTARAGLLPIRNNETGDVHGEVFFVAYEVPRAPGASARPLTFVWNGGPGSNSSFVHLIGFGPKRINTGDDPLQAPPDETVIEDNQGTWLDRTDLVFVDPVGTGFSRPTKPDYAAEFYSSLGDIASIAEFVRAYRTHFDAWDAPLFIAGESYGVWRAGGVAEALERRGQRVAGVMLISGGIPVGSVGTDEMKAALFVPGRTATALFHQKLAPDLQARGPAVVQQAETWARDEYAPALERRSALTDAERQRVIAQLARFTGISPERVDPKTLFVTSPQFTSALLADQRARLGRYDMRLTSQRPETGRSALVSRYLRSALRYNPDLAYQGDEEGFAPTDSFRVHSVGERWDWNQANTPPSPEDPNAGKPAPPPSATVGSGDGPPGGSQPWLRRAMTIDRSLRAFVAAGLYDSLNSCSVNTYLVAHIEPDLGRRITAVCYGGGHMMYDVKSERLKLRRDVGAFISSASER